MHILAQFKGRAKKKMRSRFESPKGTDKQVCPFNWRLFLGGILPSRLSMEHMIATEDLQSCQVLARYFPNFGA